jgi:predicted membrane channel-forming protein YqfA (hemolysin III family)
LPDFFYVYTMKYQYLLVIFIIGLLLLVAGFLCKILHRAEADFLSKSAYAVMILAGILAVIKLLLPAKKAQPPHQLK